MGLRPGEKLHEDMLARTELPYTYSVPGKNLLCVRPQYTKKSYSGWEKYEGVEFNSSLHRSSDVKVLVSLIEKGLGQSS